MPLFCLLPQISLSFIWVSVYNKNNRANTAVSMERVWAVPNKNTVEIKTHKEENI